MITITDKMDSIKLSTKDLVNYDKYYEGFKIKPKYDYWLVELIIRVEDNLLRDIIKVYSGDEVILDRFVNKEESSDTIILSPGDFARFKKLFSNMRLNKDYQKQAIITAYSELLSYEYYEATVLEDCPDVTMEELLTELHGYDYLKYQKEILKMTQEILNKRYKIK